jgi:hypothetical protein
VPPGRRGDRHRQVAPLGDDDVAVVLGLELLELLLLLVGRSGWCQAIT